jgi:hypothetical protein
MDLAVTGAVSQLRDRTRNSMSAAGPEVAHTSSRRRIRNGALGLAGLAVMFYLGFIALLVYRRYH